MNRAKQVAGLRSHNLFAFATTSLTLVCYVLFGVHSAALKGFQMISIVRMERCGRKCAEQTAPELYI